MNASSQSRLARLKRRMETREARIGIIGLGYVGLPLALLFSSERFQVTGFDIAQDKVDALNAGRSYIVRIPPADPALPPHPTTPRSPKWTRSSSACPPRSMPTMSPT